MMLARRKPMKPTTPVEATLIMPAESEVVAEVEAEDAVELPEWLEIAL